MPRSTMASNTSGSKFLSRLLSPMQCEPASDAQEPKSREPEEDELDKVDDEACGRLDAGWQSKDVALLAHRLTPRATHAVFVGTSTTPACSQDLW